MRTGFAGLRCGFGAAALLLACTSACAQGWPSRPIRFVMSAPAGSSIDAVGRVIAERLKEALGQPIIVDDRPGAGGTLATDLVAKSTPDGHSMVLSFNGPLAFAPHLYAHLPYDPLKDLVAVVLTTSQPNVLAINAALPADSVRQLIAHARANPGKLSYASVGAGSSSHLCMELMKAMAGIDVVHVPFNGSPPALASVAAGETQLVFAVPTAIAPLAKSGKVRMLAVSGSTRFRLLPELPTLAEAGLPKFEALAWNGVLVPARTPSQIVARLNREINAVLALAEVRTQLNSAGLEPVGGTPETFAQLIRSESEKWAPIIRRTGARID